MRTSTSPLRIAFTTIFATSLEWYDFFIYGSASALVFGKLFFPGASPVVGVLASFATFAVGFLARPFGGILFGHLGDRRGRKPMLVITVLLAAIATTLVGLAPGYATIGVAAPVVLVLLRVLQGIAIGGQWGGAMLLGAEHATPQRRGLFASFAQMGVPVGVVVANLVFLGLGAALPDAAFLAWGWRVAFVIGGLLGLVTLYLSLRVDDTPDFRTARHDRSRSPLVTAIRRRPGAIVACTGANIAINGTFYLLVTGILDYATRDLHLSKNSVLATTIVSMLISAATIPAFARLSDRVGRRPVFIAGTIALAVWAFPMFLLVETAQIPLIGVALSVGQLCVAAMMGTSGAMFADAFEADIRYSGASLAYQLSSVLGGGIAPFIMVLLLSGTGTPLSISGYILLIAAIAVIAATFLRTAPSPGASSTLGGVPGGDERGRCVRS